MKREILLRNLFSAMLSELGESHWWPGDSPFEIAIGAILTQNTNWSNVEKAIANLRANNLLTAEALFEIPVNDLAELIRPSGSFRVKAVRVRNFLNFLHRCCGLDLEKLRKRDMHSVREGLLGVSGIGPETADSILLYALDHPSFVVDAYTKRIFNRHALITEDITYEDLRSYFMDVLPPDPAFYNEYHALIVRIGKTWCAKKAGKCTACPLHPFLP